MQIWYTIAHTLYKSVETENRKEEDNYKRDYPLYSTTRLRKSTLSRLKQYGKYGTSVDEIVVMLLDRLEGKEIMEENRAW
ncbi:MAG TPA: hypothetical protein VE573_04550 [Nitrososphaeraceae archaeon]|nr:hypothetical protein [Nitrososphaeraceae archaeon]